MAMNMMSGYRRMLYDNDTILMSTRKAMMRRMSGLEEPPSGRPKLSPLPSDPPPISAPSSTNGPGLKVTLSLLLQSDILSVRISQAPSSEAKIWCQLFLLNVANEDSDSS